MEKKQLTVAIGILQNDQGQILMQQRLDSLNLDINGKWELPGGTVEFGESLEQAVVREFKEENNCEVEIVRMLPVVQSSLWPRTNGDIRHTFVHCFILKHLGGEACVQDDKVAEVRWCTKEEALSLNLLRGGKEFIEMI